MAALDNTGNQSDTKTNELFSPVENSGRIKIISKIGFDRLANEARHIDKSSSCPKIYISQEDGKMPKKLHSDHKNKKMYHLPGKKPRLINQIFDTSDRISYNFNKVDPFSISAK
jgi:hypothetical protein